MRGNSSVDVEVVRSRRIFAAPVALDDGSQRPLSDHEGLLVDLRLTPPSPRAVVDDEVADPAQQPRWQSVAPDGGRDLRRGVRAHLRTALARLRGADRGLDCDEFRPPAAGAARPAPRTLMILAPVLPFAFSVRLLRAGVRARSAIWRRARARAGGCARTVTAHGAPGVAGGRGGRISGGERDGTLTRSRCRAPRPSVDAECVQRARRTGDRRLSRRWP